jgi:hypothetical protein
VLVNPCPYRVDGEVGRFEFTTYRVFQEKKLLYDSKELFPGLKGKEWYRTRGFKEIALVYGCTEESYRKTSVLINRIRYQEGATPSRTLRDNAHLEGTQLGQVLEEKSKKILQPHNFTGEGVFCGCAAEYQQAPAMLTEERINEAIEICHRRLEAQGIEMNGDIRANSVSYEDPTQTVNISDDDVSVKRQKESRKGGEKHTGQQRKYVHDTVVHVEKEGSSYILTGSGIAQVLQFLIAFLLNNDLLHYRFQFFTDGHKILNETILKYFAWYKNIGILLDWYHLDKKCKEKLSLALKGRYLRNEILSQLFPFLWYGFVDDAIEYLRSINEDNIKDRKSLEGLIAYFERNRPYIPCYAVRKELGLRNSSNLGEKMNDLVVSDRQKHNGMSWSKEGSVALASITALIRNDEHALWFEEGDIAFKLAA